jgi:membrane-bound serine protease (ClpP class)
MAAIIGFVLAALVLIFFEVILPGGILGLLAVLCIIVATWFGYESYGLAGASLIFLGSILACVLVVLVEFRFVAKTPLGRSFFLRSKVEGRSASVAEEAQSVVGKKGEALTRLNPTGTVVIEGHQYEAFSRDGFLERGRAVEVVGKDNFRLIVKPS